VLTKNEFHKIKSMQHVLVALEYEKKYIFFLDSRSSPHSHPSAHPCMSITQFQSCWLQTKAYTWKDETLKQDFCSLKHTQRLLELEKTRGL